MTKIHKYTLSFEPEYNYDIIGICTHQSDYRLAWSLNESLNLQLSKASDNFVVNTKKEVVVANHTYFLQEEFEHEENYYLIKNKQDGKLLIPELFQMDYLFFILNQQKEVTFQLLQKIKEHPLVITSAVFDPEEFDSCAQIVF